MRATPDLNLLAAFEAFVSEGSVTGAASRLHLSVPAASRVLARLRVKVDDPVLVRSGRALVPTERALAMLPRVRAVLEEATTLFHLNETFDPKTLERDFRIAGYDAVISVLAGPMIRILRDAAPGVRFACVTEGAEAPSLRDHNVDVEIGVLRRVEPEVRCELLFEDRLVGVVRSGHPLAKGVVTLERYASFPHLLHSRSGSLTGPIEQAITEAGANIVTAASVPTVASTLLALGTTDLVGSCLERLTSATALALGLTYFELPPEIAPKVAPRSVWLAWHPRFEGDAAHGWFRSCIHRAVAELLRDGDRL